MKKLEIKTRKGGNTPQYTQNIDSVAVFLRHDDDKIIVKNGEQVNIEIYDNGKLVFSGSKNELYGHFNY